MKFILAITLSLLASATSASTTKNTCQGAKQSETILSVGTCEYSACYVKTSPQGTKEENLNIVPKSAAIVGSKHTFTNVNCIAKQVRAELRSPASKN